MKALPGITLAIAIVVFGSGSMLLGYGLQAVEDSQGMCTHQEQSLHFGNESGPAVELPPALSYRDRLVPRPPPKSGRYCQKAACNGSGGATL